jgi:hypothetical protein
MIVTGALLMTRASESPRSSGAESRNQSHVNAHTCATPTPLCACAAKNGPAHTRKNSICLHWVKLSLYQSDVRTFFRLISRTIWIFIRLHGAHKKQTSAERFFMHIAQSLSPSFDNFSPATAFCLCCRVCGCRKISSIENLNVVQSSHLLNSWGYLC